MATAGWLAGYGQRFVEAELWGIALGSARAGPGGCARIARLPVLVRRASEEDAPALSRAMAVPEPYVTSRLAQGKRCYVAEVGGRIASYGWLSTGREVIPEFERVVQFGSRAAYIWDCLTLPAYRGRGFMPALLCQMLADLSREGVRQAWAVILSGNRSSQQAFYRAGFIPVLSITYRWEAGIYDLALASAPAAPSELIATAKRLFEVATGAEEPYPQEGKARSTTG